MCAFISLITFLSQRNLFKSYNHTIIPIKGHCYYFLCFSSPGRVAFSENTKKQTSFKIDQAAARPHPVTLASACKLHDRKIENRKADENQGRATFRWWHGRRK